MKACPAITILALRSCLRARIGPSRAFSRPVVRLDAIVSVLVGTVPGAWHQFLEHAQVHRRVVGDDLDWSDPGAADGPLEEPTSCPGITPWGDQYVDDLAELVNSTVT